MKPSDAEAQFVTVAREGEIPTGTARLVRIGEKFIGLYHLDGHYFAMENECPHAGASLAHGLIDGETVVCRIHHWRFSVRTGEYLDEQRPACNRRTYPTRVHHGDVQVLI